MDRVNQLNDQYDPFKKILNETAAAVILNPQPSETLEGSRLIGYLSEANNKKYAPPNQQQQRKSTSSTTSTDSESSQSDTLTPGTSSDGSGFSGNGFSGFTGSGSGSSPVPKQQFSWSRDEYGWMRPRYQNW